MFYIWGHSTNGKTVDREELIAELRAAGIKHSTEKILRIARKADGAIVFLETGDAKSGWQHILRDHAANFADRGIPEEQIIDAVMAAVTNGKIIGTKGRSRSIYEVEFNRTIHYISVDIGSNGYIIGANPTKRQLIRRFIREKE